MSEIKGHAGNFDVVVIGGGPAGLTAGMYAARSGLSTAVVAGFIGGQMRAAHRVENFMGWEPVSGTELVNHFKDHIRRFGVKVLKDQLVNSIYPEGDGYDVFTREGLTIHGKSVIIATGKAPKRLAIPGEKELVGRGVSYCATCDAALFADKTVAVVGAAESAADAALQIASLDIKVILVLEGELEGPEALINKVKVHPYIELWQNTKPIAIEGDERVRNLKVEVGGTELDIRVRGVFIEAGSISAEEFALGLVDLNEHGEIIVDKSGATSAPGVYAAGDVTDEYGKQIVTAVGQGARAAMAAARDLRRR